MRPITNSLSVLTRFFSKSKRSSRIYIRLIRPITTRFSPIFSVDHSVHSRLIGDSRIPGGFSNDDLRVFRPARTKSFFPERTDAPPLLLGSAQCVSLRDLS